MKKILWITVLLMTMVLANVNEINDLNYEKKLQENSSVLLLFSAPWCGACRSMKPVYEKFAKLHTDKTFFGEINTDEQEKVTISYAIDSLPTLILFENGQEVKRSSGSLELDELKLFTYTKEMMKTYEADCKLGKGEACMLLGTLYEEGSNVKKDYLKASTFYEKGCTQKNAESCMYLAYMYDEALGVKQDYKLAMKYYTQACEGENVIGCRFLGYLYDEGLGTEKNYKKAFSLYLKACESEDQYACYNLGYMYEKGNGVKVSSEQALKFYKLSCSFGEDDACEVVDKLEKKK